MSGDAGYAVPFLFQKFMPSFLRDNVSVCVCISLVGDNPSFPTTRQHGLGLALFPPSLTKPSPQFRLNPLSQKGRADFPFWRRFSVRE